MFMSSAMPFCTIGSSIRSPAAFCGTLAAASVTQFADDVEVEAAGADHRGRLIDVSPQSLIQTGEIADHAAVLGVG